MATFTKTLNVKPNIFWVIDLARYICLSHDTPETFTDKVGLLSHIIYSHRDFFSEIPKYSWDYSYDRRFFLQELTCKCGRKGFRNVRKLIEHLNRCQDIKIIYERGLSKRVLYTNGVAKGEALKALRKRVTLNQVASNLELSTDVTELAENICSQYQNIVGERNKRHQKAACLYIASILKAEKRTQREISFAFNVSEVALRNNYQKIVKLLNIECY